MNNDLKPINTLPNFKRFCMTIGELPTSYLETMTYYEMLVWFTEYMKNTIIPTINNNGLAIKELQDKYIELKNYVDNYFNNLDVQEEINNKLDAMAKSGELTDIIAQYLGLAGVLSFNTIADMKQATNLVNGSTCRTLGFHEINDGGGSYYKVRNITNQDTINECSIFALHNKNLIAELIINENMNVKQFGVKADEETDNTETLNKILALGITELYFPNGTYLVNTPINVTNCKVIKGESENYTNIKAPNGFLTFETSNLNRMIKDLHIDGVSTGNNSIGITGVLTFSKMENLFINNYSTAIKTLYGTWSNIFENIFINYCTNGFIHDTNAFNNNIFRKCTFQHIDEYCTKLNGDVIKFDECDFEFSNICFSQGGRLLEVSNCYIEGNEHVFYLQGAFFQDMVNVHDNWLYAKVQPSSGWLMSIETKTNVDTETASYSFNNNYINNRVVDTIKPFAFTGDGGKTYVGISLYNNYYINIKTSRPYDIFYDDLFDTTNCPEYGTVKNATSYSTDLPLYTFNGIVWYKLDKGNIKSSLANNRLIKMLGHYDVESTGTSLIQITPDKKYGNMGPQLNDLPVIIKYSDGTMTNGRMNVDNNNFYVYVDSTKTTSKIIFNLEYYYRY